MQKPSSAIYWLSLSLILPLSAHAVDRENPKKITRHAIPGEYIVALKSGVSLQSVQALLPSQKTAPQTIASPPGSTLPTLVKITAKEAQISALKNDARIEWISPSYEYKGDVKDSDPMLPGQYHHPNMSNPEAWNTEMGKPNIIVAVTDDGVDLSHPDLKNQIWTNTGEIPGNGVDDDDNGYIDDVNGWDFAGKNNDPNPDHPADDQHGTHVAGIVAASANDVGVRGVAPGALVMPVRFYNGSSFKSFTIAEAYAYAVNNGARIITTSYSIDQFVGDKVFETALDYVQSKGAIHFNSAGNNYAENPARGVFDQLIIVCSTNGDGTPSADQKSSFSNYGRGIDICAPGGPSKTTGKPYYGILSTIPGNQYKRMSGTSMAAPAAAGAAALIWSAHPEFTREQVLAKLLNTADSIDEANPKFVGKLGQGRINTAKALGKDQPAPRLGNKAKIQIQNSTQMATLSIPVASILEPESINSSDHWSVIEAASGKAVKTELRRKYSAGSNELVFFLPSLAPGKYELRIEDKVTDPFGTPIDGDEDGVPGGAFHYNFSI